MPDLRRPALILCTAIILAACGGGSNASPAGGSSTEPTQPGSTATAAAGESPSEQPAETTAATTSSGGGTAAVCDLITVAELEQILGQSSVTESVIAGPPDTCDIQVDSAPAAAIVYTPVGGKVVFDVLAAGSDAHAFSGAGDRAFYSDSTQYVIVLKGDAMLSISVIATGSQTEEQLIDQMKQIAVKAAGRL